ncbi:hypothetical protein BH24BAC1_BH24BAC1_40440 [soil metagenome]
MPFHQFIKWELLKLLSTQTNLIDPFSIVIY